MATYDSYKDSGVKWLGQIPSHWEVVPLKTICQFGQSINITKADLIESGYPVINYGQVHSKVNTRTSLSDELIRFVSDDFKEKYPNCLCKKNDFLVADTSEDIDGCGNMIFIDKDVRPLAGYHTFSIKKIKIHNPKYLAYLFNSEIWRFQIRRLVNAVKVFTISKSILKQSSIFIPSSEEQDAIVEYLDKVTGDIDRAIEAQQKMIKALNERKQIIITNAVTKGLNPDAPLKDSGIDWLGQIPQHWEIRKLKWAIQESLQYGANEAPDEFSNSLPRYIRITDITTDGKLKEENKVSLSLNKASKYLLKKGDILFARSGATVGKTYMFNEDISACFAGYLIRATCSDIMLPLYLNYYTQSSSYENWKNYIFNKATIQNIGADKYSELFITLPAIKEQKEILSFLDTQISPIIQSISNCEKMITLLQERKRIVINEVVTGKKKVI